MTPRDRDLRDRVASQVGCQRACTKADSRCDCLRAAYSVISALRQGLYPSPLESPSAGLLSPSGTSCMAVQYSDTMACGCGLIYDVNESDPPICPLTKQPARASGGPGLTE